jgi:hypothetical protein
MDFLYRASKRLQRIKSRDRELGPQGLLKIDRAIIRNIKKELSRSKHETIKLNQVIVFSDTEEKYISLLFTRPDEDIHWLDVIHTEKIGHIQKITQYFSHTRVNILASFNRLEHMSEKAHFNVFADLTNHLEKSGEKLSAIKSDLKSLMGESLVNVVTRKYDTKRERIRPGNIDEAKTETMFMKVRRVDNFLGDTIDLRKYSIIGPYVRWDSELRRNRGRTIKYIRSLFEKKKSWRIRTNYLICGNSSVGKTAMVEALAGELMKSRKLGSSFEWKEIDLTKNASSQGKLDKRIREVEALLEQGKKVLMLVDEIDAVNANWPFNALLKPLTYSEKKGWPLVIFCAGSAKEESGEFVDCIRKMGARHGKKSSIDFLKRIPSDNRFNIPPLTVEDKILIGLSSINRHSKRLGVKIRKVEDAAMAYIGLGEQYDDNARNIDDAISAAMERVDRDLGAVKYDDLFELPRDRGLWAAHKEKLSVFLDMYTRIKS